MQVKQYRPFGSKQESLHRALWFEEDDLSLFTREDMRVWGRLLREHINLLYMMSRPRTCIVCHRPFSTFHLHHGIVSRAGVMGWPRKKRFLIETELNLIPLHGTCHLQSPPTREACWQAQCEFYGENIMREWYDALPFKVFPRRF